MNGPSEGADRVNDFRALEGEVFPALEFAGQSLHLDDDAEARVRAAHLPAEATVRTIGLVYLLLGVTFLLDLSLIQFVPRMGEMIVKQAAAAGAEVSLFRTILFFVMFFGFVLDIILGLGLRELKNWARWTIIVVTGLGLLARFRVFLSPDLLRQSFGPGLGSLVSLIGVGISVYIIFRLLTPESAFVCSKHYRFAVSETLRIRPAMGFRDWVFLGVFLVNCVLGVIAELL
jgi:hypothetical protein